MSNTKIIKTACRQRDDAQRRAADYKKRMGFLEEQALAEVRRSSESIRYGNKMAYKFAKERHKFIVASVVAALAIAFAVLK